MEFGQAPDPDTVVGQAHYPGHGAVLWSSDSTPYLSGAVPIRRGLSQFAEHLFSSN
jgi:hypothetical protein